MIPQNNCVSYFEITATISETLADIKYKRKKINNKNFCRKSISVVTEPVYGVWCVYWTNTTRHAR